MRLAYKEIHYNIPSRAYICSSVGRQHSQHSEHLRKALNATRSTHLGAFGLKTQNSRANKWSHQLFTDANGSASRTPCNCDVCNQWLSCAVRFAYLLGLLYPQSDPIRRCHWHLQRSFVIPGSTQAQVLWCNNIRWALEWNVNHYRDLGG